MLSLASFKHLPLDVGQDTLKETTHGKVLAFAHVPCTREGRALDAGAREGYWTKRLQEKGYSVTGIDLHPQSPDVEKLDLNKPLPFPDNSFDLVWCSEVIEHVYYPEKLRDEFIRVTKPGGQIMLTTPNSVCFIYAIFLLFGKTHKDVQNKDHKHFFSLSHIKALFPNARITGYFPWLLVPFSIEWGIRLFSPTFVITARKDDGSVGPWAWS